MRNLRAWIDAVLDMLARELARILTKADIDAVELASTVAGVALAGLFVAPGAITDGIHLLRYLPRWEWATGVALIPFSHVAALTTHQRVWRRWATTLAAAGWAFTSTYCLHGGLMPMAGVLTAVLSLGCVWTTWRLALTNPDS